MTRQEAKKAGLRHYNGRKCRNCGTTLKFVSTCNCFQCASGYNKTAHAKQRNWKRTIAVKYGVEPEQYQQLLEQQNSVCAICGEKDTEFDNARLCVDHDHMTQKVRGLLCRSCNLGLGSFGDDIVRLEAAIQYLTKHTRT
jgi:hypothetical protein